MSVETLKYFFDIAAVVLLFLTFAAGAGVLVTGNIINKRQEEKLRNFDSSLTAAKTELGKQQERAANADSRVAGLEADASKQQERAAIAEKSLLELQQTLADRSLTDVHIKEIADTLKAFSGQEYTVTAYWDSKESLNIANRIHAALLLAHWKYSPKGSEGMMLGGVVGVKVWHHPDADENTKKAAQNLISVLTKYGIQAIEAIQIP